MAAELRLAVVMAGPGSVSWWRLLGEAPVVLGWKPCLSQTMSCALSASLVLLLEAPQVVLMRCASHTSLGSHLAAKAQCSTA